MTLDTTAYEKLGAFYLGRPLDPGSGETAETPLLYDSKDLVTHGVCVGMTGSGKTGLCVCLLEEAAIDGIPAIVVDVKGDLGNLLLTFPELRGEDFRPWIAEDDAARRGLSPEAYAEAQAELWRRGLAEWGQDGERIRRLRQAAELAIYTPGSDAGLPVSILSSFDAPPESVRSDGDLLRERIGTTVSSLLGLLGIDADPLRSREHILLANLLDDAWKNGRNLDLPGLIQGIQKPPMERVGVLPLDTFYPAKERFELAMAINNLLAAPGFESWLSGTPLDLSKILYTPEGKPRVAIFSIAHLQDAERMFFVSLLLNQTLGWMRSRPGTTSLRAILYMDEIFGYLPPVANPPSKQPLLTLLKQARAFGLGLLLATQNPVDLDYKALSNIGTWFLGRLQTERDKARVLDGLETVAGGLSRSEIEELLSSLDKRVFLLHDVHEEAPVLFKVRWAMSYLRGPLTRGQIQRLMAGSEPEPTAVVPPPLPPEATETSTKAAGEARDGAETARPVLPPEVPQRFLPLRGRPAGDLLYRPHLLGAARVHFVDSRRDLEAAEEVVLLGEIAPEGSVDWHQATDAGVGFGDLATEPSVEAPYAMVPGVAGEAKRYRSWEKELDDVLYRSRRYPLWKSPTFELISTPGESEREFRARLAERAREERDAETEKLRDRYAKKLDAVADRIRRAEHKVEKEAEQAREKKVQSWLKLGSSVLGAVLGRKKLSVTNVRRASSALSGFSRSAKEAGDVERAEEDLAELIEERDQLAAELEREVAELADRFDPAAEELETFELKPRRTDVDVRLVALAWAPYRRGGDGSPAPAWVDG